MATTSKPFLSTFFPESVTTVLIKWVCFLSVFTTSYARAQDTTGLNKTQKNVLEGAKQTLQSDDSTLTSVLMIALVICVVAVALWLSFKSSSGDEKHKKVLDRHRKSGQN